MDRFDVIVIGGGPGGSMAALESARSGLSVLLVERDNVIGIPVRCAEGVDHKGLTEFFEPDPRWISSTINGYSLVAPDGTEVGMNLNGELGYILDRTVFDRMIAEKAAEAGAIIMTGTEALSMSRFDGMWSVKLNQSGSTFTVDSSVVIAADGVESRVARWAGLKTGVSLHDMETCAQVTVAGADIKDDIFKLYFTNEFAPGGYAWVFPKGKGKANIGLGISGDHAAKKSPKEYLNGFLLRYFPNVSYVGMTYGGISCSGGIEKSVTDGLIVVGDAAHLANPITGGGIINAIISGKIAGETVTEAIKRCDFSENILKIYEKKVNNRIGTMNRRFYKLKEGIFNITDKGFNDIAHEIVSLPQEKRTPIRVLGSALIKKPELLLVLVKVIL